MSDQLQPGLWPGVRIRFDPQCRTAANNELLDRRILVVCIRQLGGGALGPLETVSCLSRDVMG